MGLCIKQQKKLDAGHTVTGSPDFCPLVDDLAAVRGELQAAQERVSALEAARSAGLEAVRKIEVWVGYFDRDEFDVPGIMELISKWRAALEDPDGE